MASAARLYRTPQSETNLRSCSLTTTEFVLLVLERDLEQLCAEGMLEAFRDEHNVVRYRPKAAQ